MIDLKKSVDFLPKSGQGSPSLAYMLPLPNGNIIFSDESNHSLSLYSPELTFIKTIGGQGAKEGEFYYPKGLCLDSKGYLYVADSWNHRVQKFSPDLEFVASFGGYGDGVEQLNEPYAIAIGKDGRLLVVDRCNHRIQIIDTDGGFHGYIGRRGTTLEGDMAELNNTPIELFGAPYFEFPNDIALDSSGNIYVVDTNNHRIAKFDPELNYLYSFGCKGDGLGQFRFPYSIAIDENDLVLVSDMNNDRLQVMTPQGEAVGNTPTSEATCPSFISIYKGKIVAGEGLNVSAASFEYESRPLGDIYSNLEGLNITYIIFLLESGKRKEAIAGLDNLIKSSDRETIISLILDNPQFAKDITSLLPEVDSIDMFNIIIDEGIDIQREKILKLKDERIDISKGLIKGELDRESAILNGEDRHDAELADIEIKDKEILRSLKGKILAYKRLLDVKGDLIESSLSDTKNEQTIDQASLYIRVVLQHLISFLEEREEYDSAREGFFNDTTRSNEENLTDFRYHSRLFEVLNDIIPVFLEVAKEKIALITRYVKGRSDIERTLFAEKILLGEGGTPFWQIAAKVVLLTADIFDPSDNYIEYTLKDFISAIGETSLLEKIIPPESGNDEDRMLFNIFNLLIVEQAGVKENDVSKTLKAIPSIDAEDNTEQLKGIIEEKLQESGKLLEELGMIESRLNGAPIHDEASRLALINRRRTFEFAERINLTTLVSLFFIFRINIVRYLKLDDIASVELYKEWLEEKQQTLVDTIADTAWLDEIKDNCKREVALKKNHFTKIIIKSISDILSLLRGVAKSKNSSPILVMSNGKEKKIEYVESIGGYGSREGELNHPTFMAIDKYGNLFVSDERNHRVQKFSPDGKFLMSIGRHGHREGQFFYPEGIAIDNASNIYVCDMGNNRIQKFSPDGVFIKSLGEFGSLDKPVDIATDGENLLFVADCGSHKIHKFSLDVEFLSSFGEYGNGSGEFNGPVGIDIDKKGMLVVAERLNNRVQRFDTDGNFIDMLGFEETLKSPMGLCHADNHLYIADLLNNAVKVFSDELEYMYKVGSYGRGLFEFNMLSAPVVYGNKMYVSSYQNHKVDIFRLS